MAQALRAPAMLRAAGLDRLLPARDNDERSTTSMLTTFSQVSVNTCMHASERAAERNITKSDIKGAKAHGVISLQILNYEDDTEDDTDTEDFFGTEKSSGQSF